jgi:hypothetical protein
MHNGHDSLEDMDARDVLYVAGGMALLVMGVGMVMTHRQVRKTVMEGVSRFSPDLAESLKSGVAGLMPDVERYLKVRSM